MLVPLKRLEEAKSRLRSLLPGPERAALMRAMLDHVLEAVRAAERPSAVTLVSSDPAAFALARRFGIACWNDRGLPWNEALAAAMGSVVREPVVAVVSADLPLASAGDVDELAGLVPERGIVIARALDGGTNAVAMRPPGVSPTCFGTPKSAARHAALAGARGLRAAILDRPGLAFDLDTPEDAERLLSHPDDSTVRELLAGTLARMVPA